MSDLYALQNGSLGNAQAKINEMFAANDLLKGELEATRRRLKDAYSRCTALEADCESQRKHCDSIYASGVDVANMLGEMLESERALADRLGEVTSGIAAAYKEAGWVMEESITRAVAAWKEARK